MPDSAHEPPEVMPKPSPEDVRAQVEKILHHREFADSERMQDFLRFIVEEKLSGRVEGLKGYTIGVEVFGRDESFDPQIDPIVRVEAGRLRRKLKLYYSEADLNDPIHIEVPKGSYVPVWRVRPPPESPPSEGSAEGVRAADSTDPVPLEPQGVKRKLTTILAADVEGYSRLMSADEEATLKTLSAYRQIIDGLISRHEGRLFGSAGDSVLAEFGSPVEAVRCAIAIQEEFATRNAELPDDRRMRYRIGVNLGDVMVEDENLLGDGVNVAARLEGLAEPGGICISGDVYRQVRGKLEIRFDDIGEQPVKNIAEPVRAYRVRLEPGAAGSVTAAKKPSPKRWGWAVAAAVVILGGAAVLSFYARPPQTEPASLEKFAFALPKDPSIAVLPFANLSGDPEQAYFSDGLTDILITELAKVPGIFVIARQSTLIYKKRQVTIRQVAEDLGVQYVLEGSVQKAGDRVRINTQLIDALKGHHLWAERYDRPLKDAFAVQDEIARKAVTALKGEVQWRSLAQGVTTAEGFDYFLRGLAHFNRVTKEDNARARQLFEKVVELEPKWATGWSLLGVTHRVDYLFGWSKDRRRSLERAFELAEKALSLDDTNPGANSLLGRIHLIKRDHEKAIAYGRKSVTLAPNSSFLKVILAQTLNYSGHPEEAVELIQKAMRLNPRYPGWWLYQLGQGYRLSGQYDKAIAALEEAVVRHPNLPRPRSWLAIAYSQTGEIEKAQDEVEKVLQLHPKYSTKSYARVNLYKNPADLKRDLEALRKSGLPE